jgi:hypothetical protein
MPFWLVSINCVEIRFCDTHVVIFFLNKHHRHQITLKKEMEEKTFNGAPIWTKHIIAYLFLYIHKIRIYKIYAYVYVYKFMKPHLITDTLFIDTR